VQSLGGAPRRHGPKVSPPFLPRWHPRIPLHLPTQAGARIPFVVGGIYAKAGVVQESLIDPVSSASTLAASLVASALPPLASGPRVRVRFARPGAQLTLDLLAPRGGARALRLLTSSASIPSGFEAAGLAWVRFRPCNGSRVCNCP
jgi:hypothetical protein